MLSWLNLAFALAVLTYASICDLKFREVTNRLWVFAIPVGAVVSILNVVHGNLSVEKFLFSITFATVFGMILSYIGLFGGADMKALIFIAVSAPSYPEGLNCLFGDVIGLPILEVFMNSIMFSMAYPITIFFLNIAYIARRGDMFRGLQASLAEKAVLLFTARRLGFEKIEQGLHYFPAEEVVEEKGKLIRKPRHFIHAEADLEPLIETMRRNRHLFNDGVLVSPTVPFIVFFLSALAVLPAGNIMLHFIRLAMRFFK